MRAVVGSGIRGRHRIPVTMWDSCSHGMAHPGNSGVKRYSSHGFVCGTFGCVENIGLYLPPRVNIRTLFLLVKPQRHEERAGRSTKPPHPREL